METSMNDLFIIQQLYLLTKLIDELIFSDSFDLPRVTLGSL